MQLDGLVDREFYFRALDDDGALARYEALLTYVDQESGLCYLVYADALPDDRDEVGTYASIASIDEVEQIAANAPGGGIPRRPPVLELRDITDDAGWSLINELLDAIDQDDDDE